MKIRCNIFLDKKVDKNEFKKYRTHLYSLIKESFERSGSDGKDFLNTKVKKDRVMKPFTFSAYFPKNNGADRKNNGVDRNNQSDKDYFFSFFFSTNDYDFLMRFYNGLLNVKNNGFSVCGCNIVDIKGFYLFPEINFTKNEAVFKTISPFLVRDPEDGDKYVYPEDCQINMKENKDPDHWKYWRKVSKEEFINNLRKSLKKLVEKEMPGFEDGIEEIILNDKNSVIIPIYHCSGNSAHRFQMTLPGIKGFIKIKAQPEVLKLFYDIGIGARRSEGFGMLEVE